MSHLPRIDVIGSGFVGEATGRGFLDRGYVVRFVDVKASRLAELRAQGLDACTPEELSTRTDQAEVSLFTVNTPTHEGKINLESLYAAAINLGNRLATTHDYHVVVVRSTVVPGTTEKIIACIEKQSGKKVGRDFGVCMNPEYLREKSAVQDFARPWIVVIGEYDTRSGDVLFQLYKDFDCPKYRVSLREAEMQKYVHNLYNAVKITFFNEMRQIAQQSGVDPEHIFAITAKSAEGMWRPEYGIKDHGPFDGSCLPKDTHAYLTWAQGQGLAMPLLATTIEVNNKLFKVIDPAVATALAATEKTDVAQPEVAIQALVT